MADADRLCENCGKLLVGTWPSDDLRRAFVSGAKWWQFVLGSTAFPSEVDAMEAEAERRYGRAAASEREDA
jgi:hypothetical protein